MVACDDASSEIPLCSTTFTDGSEHTAAVYERGCVDESGSVVVFTRYQCESRIRPDLYHAEGLGSGRPKGSGVFSIEGVAGRPNYEVVDYCPDIGER